MLASKVASRLKERNEMPPVDDVEAHGAVGRWHWAIVQDEVHWSKGLSRILGVERRQSDLAGYLAMVHPADREYAARAFGQARADRSSVHHRYRVTRPDGEHRTLDCWIHVTSSTDGTVEQLYGTCRDVTIEVALAAEIEQLEKRPIPRKVRGIAHDLNNILAVLLMLCDRAAAECSEQPGAVAAVDEIKGQGRRAAHLTKALLGKKPPASTAESDLADAIRGMERTLVEVAGTDIELEVRLGAERLPARVERLDFELALTNLVLNARDAMPDGGRLVIDARTGYAGSGSDAAGLQPERYVRVSVTDTGQGITPEVRSRMFSPFFTTKAERGHGLGLAEVNDFVAASGGFVLVESAPGEGTRIVLHLPAA